MALEGALKFFPGIKIEPEQELCFQGLVVLKERCTQSMEKPHIPASAETMSESGVRVLVSQDRNKEDDINVSDI